MKNFVLILTVSLLYAIGGTAFGQSAPGEGWYDSGDGKANAPGTSKYRDINDSHDANQNARRDTQQAPQYRGETVEVQVISESGDYAEAIQAAKDKLISMGAKAIVVAAVTRIVGQQPGFVFKIALGVAFPATPVADGLRRSEPSSRPAPPPKPQRDPTDRDNGAINKQ